MVFNTCKTCGASNGRAGILINDECGNCYETRKSGEVFIHANLSRTPEEIEKTMAILGEPKLKHTPAPWFISHSPMNITDNSTILNPLFYLHIKNKKSIGGHIIAKAIHKNRDALTANAKLIAAAPDLLEELIKVADFLGKLAPYLNEEVGYGQECKVIEALNKTISNVIEKATK